jgi:hypothetical protein
MAAHSESSVHEQAVESHSPMQAPVASQASSLVQSLLSSQVLPSEGAVMQVPLAQMPTLQSSVSGHVIGVPAHWPAVQTSVSVQESASSQSVLSAASTNEHSLFSQTASSQAAPDGQSAAESQPHVSTPAQFPLSSQRSSSVHASPSSQEAPESTPYSQKPLAAQVPTIHTSSVTQMESSPLQARLAATHPSMESQT